MEGTEALTLASAGRFVSGDQEATANERLDSDSDADLEDEDFLVDVDADDSEEGEPVFYDEVFQGATGDLTKRYARMKEGGVGNTSEFQQQAAQARQQKQQQRQQQEQKANPSSGAKQAMQPLDFARFQNRLNVTMMSDFKAGSTGSRKAEGEKAQLRDKSDRATVEQVLDPRTRMILFKMLAQNLIEEINGCVSTGKEANVYHARTAAGEERAIKVYKTSILVFKDRDRYVTGEFRFRHGYGKHNPRQMVKVWAEKEMRNLRRYAVWC